MTFGIGSCCGGYIKPTYCTVLHCTVEHGRGAGGVRSMVRDGLLSSKRAVPVDNDNAGPGLLVATSTVTSSLLLLYSTTGVDRVTVSPCHCHTP